MPIFVTTTNHTNNLSNLDLLELDPLDALDDSPKEACGVFGIFSDTEDVAKLAYFALYALQHRGQESAGIATFGDTGTYTHKDMGLVSQVFNEHTARHRCPARSRLDTIAIPPLVLAILPMPSRSRAENPLRRSGAGSQWQPG
jgi:hypothetical protein